MSIADRIAELLTNQGAITAQGLATLGRLRAEGITNAANINAAAQLQSGNAWAQAIQALGQIPGQAYGQYQQIKGQELQDQQAKQRIEANALALNQANRQEQGNQILGSMMQSTGQPLPEGQQGPVDQSYLDANGLLDAQKVTHALASGGYGDLVPDLLTKVDKINDGVLKHQELQTKFDQQHTVMLADMASGALTLWKSGVPLDQSFDIVSSPGVSKQRFDPAEAAQVKEKLMRLTPEQQEAALNAMIDAGDKVSPTKNLGEGVKEVGRSGRVLAENPKPVDPGKGQYTINGQRFDAAGNPIGPLVPPQTPAARPPESQRIAIDLPGVGTNLLADYIPGPNGGRVVYNGQDVTGTAKLHERPLASGAGGLTPDAAAKRADAKTVAEGIKDFADGKGGISPEVLLSSRTTEQGMALNAELRKMGVDTDKLVREWSASKAAIRSLNGAQQIRLAQVINKASASLDQLDALNKQWSDNAARWGLKALNHAELKAAQNGAYGPEAASVAQRLEAQIADVTSELGQGIMGGNSPTDHALSLASKNLSSDWTQKVLGDSIKQVRYNLNLAQQARNEMLGQLGVTSTQFETPPPAGTAPRGPNPFRK